MELTFELGFDWNAPAVEGVRDGVYPLQVFLVHDSDSAVISSCNSAQVKTNRQLTFRVYDFTDPKAGEPTGAAPVTLQILFTRATTIGNPPFSPILANGAPVAQLASTQFPSPRRPVSPSAPARWGAGTSSGRTATSISTKPGASHSGRC